jgi:uncharacterized protein (TIGR03435 family)
MTAIRSMVAPACAMFLLSSVSGQTLEFDVASVKIGSGERIGVGIRGEEVRATNLPLRTIVQWAYGIRPLRREGLLEGGPAWIDSDGFDIVAKAPMRLSLDQARAMMRALLSDRFKLRVHTEARQTPVFALVLAKKDGALGPGLRRSARDCSAYSAAVLNGEFNNEFRRDGCELKNVGPGMAIRGSATLPVMLPLISRGREIDRPIVDRTGLAGTFDIELTFTPVRPGIPGRGEIPVPADGTSLFTALQEQLGLKLESARVPMDVVVIDSVERPTPD